MAKGKLKPIIWASLLRWIGSMPLFDRLIGKEDALYRPLDRQSFHPRRWTPTRTRLLRLGTLSRRSSARMAAAAEAKRMADWAARL